MKTNIILFSAICALIGCQPNHARNPAAIVIDAQNADDTAVIEKAIGYLRGACTGLKYAGTDLINGHATLFIPTRPTQRWQERRYGWRNTVALEIEISDDLHTLPHTTGHEPISGHHCIYEIGSGEKPGITTAKKVCEFICGWNDYIFPLPELAGLLGTTPFERDYDYDALETEAFKGVYQAQRNLAYVMEHEERDIEAYNPVQACAWRKVILLSGHPDLLNENITCGKLNDSQQRSAIVQTQELLSKIETAKHKSEENRVTHKSKKH